MKLARLSRTFNQATEVEGTREYESRQQRCESKGRGPGEPGSTRQLYPYRALQRDSPPPDDRGKDAPSAPAGEDLQVVQRHWTGGDLGRCDHGVTVNRL